MAREATWQMELERAWPRVKHVAQLALDGRLVLWMPNNSDPRGTYGNA